MEREEALAKLRSLINQDLRVLAKELDITVFSTVTGKLNKGWAGQTVERYLGLPINSGRNPNLGTWELKVVPLVRDNFSNWKVKETMAITMLDKYEVSQKNFKSSHLFVKLGKIIVVARHWHSKQEEKSKVIFCNDFKLEGTELYEIVRDDYMQIRNAIQNGINLTGRMGKLIQPRTKGAGHGSTSRAFYARKELVEYIIGLKEYKMTDCIRHAGLHNQFHRQEMELVMKRLPSNQSGYGRHKCPYCAYEAGYRAGFAAAAYTHIKP